MQRSHAVTWLAVEHQLWKGARQEVEDLRKRHCDSRDVKAQGLTLLKLELCTRTDETCLSNVSLELKVTFSDLNCNCSETSTALRLSATVTVS